MPRNSAVATHGTHGSGWLVMARDPDDLIQRAMAALQRGARQEASRLANSILEGFGPEPNALLVLANLRAQAGETAQAIELLERARTLMPTHVHVLVNLAALYRSSGRLPEARATLEAALEVEPRFAIAHNNLGNVYGDLGEQQSAQRSYQRAAELDPGYADPLARLARIAEERHELGAAEQLAKRALQLAPGDSLALLTLARARLRQDDATHAAALLQRLLGQSDLPATHRVLALGYLGEAYDQLKRFAEAFAAFTAANELQHERYAATLGQELGPLSPAGIARLTAFMEQGDRAAWRPTPPAALTPAFLVGFPRSGTTLLDQMLASHPHITTLEERDTLLDAAGEMLQGSEALKRWPDLAEEDIARLRERYWQRVRDALRGTPLRALFVDKQPLNAALLPLVHRLFPSARIILALRDPRDVLLSCYQQRFGMNAAMYQLLRLDTASAYYDAVMRLVSVSRARLPLSVHPVRYEDLVSNFETTLGAVLVFLGLPWHEAVRAYAQTARERSISTPSAAQVVRPLYRSALGRWRNYRDFLRPHLAPLAPWVREYGYEAE